MKSRVPLATRPTCLTGTMVSCHAVPALMKLAEPSCCLLALSLIVLSHSCLSSMHKSVQVDRLLISCLRSWWSGPKIFIGARGSFPLSSPCPLMFRVCCAQLPNHYHAMSTPCLCCLRNRRAKFQLTNSHVSASSCPGLPSVSDCIAELPSTYNTCPRTS